ncbi:hypothetical protein [Hymenobacter antarcticus]|uniref:Por secretion system C-terminal sorting domain-containing protein n=1 Tax=Hymenobacter antarcticus TaxID=486270 RepID=A0ABP7Q3W9_9BACT
MTRLYKILWLVAGTGLAQPVSAQYFTNAGAQVTVQAGAALYVGLGGLTNNAAGVMVNAGTVRVDGPVANPGLLNLSTGALELRGDFTNTGTVLPGSSPVTFSGLANQTLTPGGSPFFQVVVNKPTAGANTLHLGGDLTVSNLLSLGNGLVNTKMGAVLHTLRLPHGATLSGESTGRYVVGALEITRNAVSGAAVNFGHGAVLDPKTNNLGTVVIARVAGLTTADVSFGQNFTNNSLKGIDRLWTVAPTTQPSAVVQLTLSWLPDNDNGLSSFAQARMWQQSAPGQTWAAVGPTADASSRSLTMSPTVLNRFTVSNAANPLPVTLVEFTAQAEGPMAVRLKWATATEQQNSRFGVERSTDGHQFAEVAALPGAGTSTTRHAYAWLDEQLPAGILLLYYRLAQTDQNGDVNYSPVRALRRTATAAGFVVYPTQLATGQTATYLYTGLAQPGSLQVLDLVGRPVRVVAVDGRAQGMVPLAGLASGSYLLRYVTATSSFSARCVLE